jgi:hypothetical protein
MSRNHATRLVKVGATLVSAVLFLTVSGCSDQNAAQNVTIHVQKDRSRMVLPLDPYQLLPSAFEGYAIDIASVDCMRARGYDNLQMIPYNFTAPQRKTFNGLTRIFDVTVAQEFGYRWDKPTEYDYDLVLQRDQAMGTEMIDALVECNNQAYKDLDLPQPEDWVGQSTFSLDPDDAPSVRAAGAKWHECMASLGLADLVDGPWAGIPSPTLEEKWDFSEHEDGTPGMFDKPTPEEVTVATQDAKCQESSGYAEAYYNAWWDQQVEYIKDHWRELENERAALAHKRQVLEGVIAAYEK